MVKKIFNNNSTRNRANYHKGWFKLLLEEIDLMTKKAIQTSSQKTDFRIKCFVLFCFVLFCTTLVPSWRPACIVDKYEDCPQLCGSPTPGWNSSLCWRWLIFIIFVQWFISDMLLLHQLSIRNLILAPKISWRYQILQFMACENIQLVWKVCRVYKNKR